MLLKSSSQRDDLEFRRGRINELRKDLFLILKKIPPRAYTFNGSIPISFSCFFSINILLFNLDYGPVGQNSSSSTMFIFVDLVMAYRFHTRRAYTYTKRHYSRKNTLLSVPIDERVIRWRQLAEHSTVL